MHIYNYFIAVNISLLGYYVLHNKMAWSGLSLSNRVCAMCVCVYFYDTLCTLCFVFIVVVCRMEMEQLNTRRSTTIQNCTTDFAQKCLNNIILLLENINRCVHTRTHTHTNFSLDSSFFTSIPNRWPLFLCQQIISLSGRMCEMPSNVCVCVWRICREKCVSIIQLPLPKILHRPNTELSWIFRRRTQSRVLDASDPLCTVIQFRVK